MYYLIVGGEDKLEDDHQANQGGLVVIETKCSEELLSANQNSKQEETQEGIHLPRQERQRS